jgi:hypothetical protein
VYCDLENDSKLSPSIHAIHPRAYIRCPDQISCISIEQLRDCESKTSRHCVYAPNVYACTRPDCFIMSVIDNHQYFYAASKADIPCVRQMN